MINAAKRARIRSAIKLLYEQFEIGCEISDLGCLDPELHSLLICQSGEQEPPQHLVLLGVVTEPVERTAPKLR